MIDLTNKKVLKLTLEKVPFDLMEKGLKFNEYRKPSDWIKSRLFDKQGNKRVYDYVKFTNGYGNDKPFFIVEFLRFFQASFSTTIIYAGGFDVVVEAGDFVIELGKIVERGNLR